MAGQVPTPPPNTSQPVLVALSFLAAMSIINGGLAALEVLPVKVVGCIALGTAAATYGIGYYLRAKVVPAEAVAASLDGEGVLRSGPADQTIPTGTEVEISPAGRSPYSDNDGHTYSG